VIPPTLVEPFSPTIGQRTPRRVALTVGAFLCGFSVLAGVLWFMTLTPFGFSRFAADAGRSGDRVEDIDQPGTYYVFEERAGASDPGLPPPVSVVVTSRGGDTVPVEVLVHPGVPANPHAYRTPWHEGRAIARFTIAEPGEYHVRAVPLGRRNNVGYSPRVNTRYAVGREAATSWLGGWPGAAVFIGVPLAAGLLLVILGRMRPQTATQPDRVGRIVDSTTLTAHG